MARLFGTDGVRGIANTELTCTLAYRIGQAAVQKMGTKIVVGKDTRLSGDMLESAVAAGIMSAGGTVLSAGIIPTPAVALLVRLQEADGGIVLSASHNPPEYNGIKLFDRCGFKLPDAVEDDIEKFVVSGGLESAAQTGSCDMVSGDAVGSFIRLKTAQQVYIDHVVSSITDQGLDFSHFHIALDCGHGASSATSPQAFAALGAKVSVINDTYTGTDINVSCGSTCLEPLKQLMKESGATIGIAHDGDADRVMFVTPEGHILDGDIVEAVCALDLKARGKLAHDTVVSTVMCNLGFKNAMADAGINVIQTKVGDRYVLEEMRSGGYVLGGEQSGHMIFLDYNSTGDGLMTACQLLAALMRSNTTPEEACSVFERYPQTLINVAVADKHAVSDVPAVHEALAAAEERLGKEGRVLLRPSGTEPLIRIMVEARDVSLAKEIAEQLANIVSASAC